MSHSRPAPLYSRARLGGNGRFYVALGLALAVHAGLFVLPIQKQQARLAKAHGLLSVRLATLSAEDGPGHHFPVESETQPPVQSDRSVPPIPAPPSADTEALSAEPKTRPARVDAVDTERVKRSILASQFLPAEQKSPEGFSLQAPENATELRPDFYLPHRASMYEVMMPPLPELPFAHEPGFVQFSYTAPGFLGELQYFFDVITPEFEFKTKHGTRVKCALILVIAGCVWD